MVSPRDTEGSLQLNNLYYHGAVSPPAQTPYLVSKVMKKLKSTGRFISPPIDHFHPGRFTYMKQRNSTLAYRPEDLTSATSKPPDRMDITPCNNFMTLERSNLREFSSSKSHLETLDHIASE